MPTRREEKDETEPRQHTKVGPSLSQAWLPSWAKIGSQPWAKLDLLIGPSLAQDWQPSLKTLAAKLSSLAAKIRAWLPSLGQGWPGQCWHPRAKELTRRQAWDMLGPSLAPKGQECQGYPILGQGWPKNSVLAGRRRRRIPHVLPRMYAAVCYC